MKKRHLPKPPSMAVLLIFGCVCLAVLLHNWDYLAVALFLIWVWARHHVPQPPPRRGRYNGR